LILEVLRGHSFFQASKEPEDKQFFKRQKEYTANYLTKCDAIYYRLNDLEKTLQLNPHLTIVWTMRDPRDMVLSKIYRGQPRSKGGDGSDRVADDATPKGCIEDMFHSYSYYKYLKQNHRDKLLVVKMEDVILDIERESKRLCRKLNLDWEGAMTHPVPRLRQKEKRKRYKNLDKKQIGLWKRWQEVYDGFFSKNDYAILSLFKKIDPIRQEFLY
jgi:hypothetical protein